MSTININTPDGNILTLNAPDNSSPDQIHSAVIAAAKDYSSKKMATTISTIARPLLEGGGAAMGGIAGLGSGPAAPFLAPAGGALGFGIGNQAANILDQKMGISRTPANLREAIQSGASSIYQGAQNEAVGAVAKPIIGLAGKIAKPILSTMTGVPANDIATVAESPSALMPGKLKQAATRLNIAKEAAGIVPNSEADIENALREDRPFLQSIREKMAAGMSIEPREALEGNQAVNRLIKTETDKSAQRGLGLLKDKFEKILSQYKDLVPSIKNYSEAKAGANFQNFLPITKNGQPAVVRTLAMMSRLMGPQAFLASPALMAGPVAAGGAIGKIANNPTMMRALIPFFKRRIGEPLLNAIQEDQSK